jgi:phosphopantothenoylcysteine synthetase/decarboxylase
MSDRPVITVVVCGAGPATQVDKLVTAAQERGWSVGVTATPAAVQFIDIDMLEALTRRPVRIEDRPAGERRRETVPDPEAVIVAPATFNTVCKLADGIADNYALHTVAEMIGKGVRTVVLPFVNTALAGRRPFVEAVESLRAEGVRVLFGPGEWEPHQPGTGDDRVVDFPWEDALAVAAGQARRMTP